MATENGIIEYLGRQTASFGDVPVNDVDSLIFCTVSYLYFEEGVLHTAAPDARIPLPVALCGIPHEKLFGTGWLSDFNAEGFLAALLASPRYAPVHMGYYVNDISERIDTQFSAITFYLPDGTGAQPCAKGSGCTAYVAFRGTDNTLAGWKEDFNLACMDVVPAQRRAAQYVSGIASCTTGPMILGGHSKGGNLSEFAALTVHADAYDRICAVYNHDGPSFINDPSPRIDTAPFKAKLHKTVPESSVFGMLMERRPDYRIIRAQSLSFLQHAPLNWIVEGDDFVTVKQLSTTASLFDESMNSWMKDYTSEQRAQFVDTIFQVLKSTEASTWNEFAANQMANIGKVITETTKLDPEMRDRVIDMFTAVARVYSSEAFKHVAEKAPVVLPSARTSRKIELPELPQLPFFKNQDDTDTKEQA